MAEDKATELLTLLQPELLTVDDLIRLIKGILNAVINVQHNNKAVERCCRVQNLTSLPKERLVRLFRQLILPLPQRRYRGNQRGKLLTARRVKSGLEGGGGGGGEDSTGNSIGSGILLGGESGTRGKRANPGGDRLKPAPDSSTPNKIRLTGTSDKRSNPREDLDRIVIKDRRKEERSIGRVGEKRSNCVDDKRCSNDDPAKKQRTAIKWP